MGLSVKKRSGAIEELSLEKIHKVLEWACEGITNVSISEIELRANIQLYDGILADDIHELLIKSAAELIDEDTPNYQYVAARLINYKLRKLVYGSYEPIPLYDIVVNNVNAGVYDPQILDLYAEEDWILAEKYIKHQRDNYFAYAGMEQFRGKYLVQDRSTGKYYETPQVLYMLVAMTLFSSYPNETRMKWVKRYYDAISTFKISLPTPIMAGVRTNTRQFSSCVLIESGDSLDSIFATGTAIGKYAAKRAGIGVNGGNIRAVGSKVGTGEIVHTGVIPYWRFFRGALKSCSQGGIRGASATINYPFWHLEAEDLLVLKNAKGTFENRIRDMDYCIHLNKIFFERVLSKKHITFFSPNEVPDLISAFYSGDTDLFRQVYEKYESNKTVRKKQIDAEEFFTKILIERQQTGRIYLFFADNVNSHSSFQVPVKMTNLCLMGDTEILVKIGDNIERIRIDTIDRNFIKEYSPQVWSRDLNKNKDIWSPIVDGGQTGISDDIIEIEDQGYRIMCTPDHLVYTENRGYVRAEDLTKEDRLCINSTEINLPK